LISISIKENYDDCEKYKKGILISKIPKYILSKEEIINLTIKEANIHNSNIMIIQCCDDGYNYLNINSEYKFDYEKIKII
jgi:hypothetical protein